MTWLSQAAVIRCQQGKPRRASIVALPDFYSCQFLRVDVSVRDIEAGSHSEMVMRTGNLVLPRQSGCAMERLYAAIR
jgi:hypothetical protein